MASQSSWTGKWTINSASNTTFPFFQDQDTLTISGTTPSFQANAAGAPTFTDVKLPSPYTQLTANFSYNNKSYPLTVTLVTNGSNNSLSGSVGQASGGGGGVGDPVATWTTTDGPQVPPEAEAE